MCPKSGYVLVKYVMTNVTYKEELFSKICHVTCKEFQDISEKLPITPCDRVKENYHHHPGIGFEKYFLGEAKTLYSSFGCTNK